MSSTAAKPAASAAPASAVAAAVVPVIPGGASRAPALIMPSEKTILASAKMCVEQDKQLAFDYYADSISNKAFIGENIHNKEKNLFKSTDEYTSPIRAVFKANDDLIVITENTVYIVSAKIGKKPVE